MKKFGILLTTSLLASISHPIAASAQLGERIEDYRIAKDAYIYGFPMIAAYKAMYQFNVDKKSPQYKGPFNTVVNEGRVFTPKDTAIVTPNSDTPYSLIQVDLRAEPLVFCVPAIDKDRYYSVQLSDMYSFNYGYVGSRTTGNGAGCYMIAGPNWSGEKPAGIARVFNTETQFGLVIFRTQLLNPADIDNVKKIQAQYTAQPLSQFLKQPSPQPAPLPKFPAFSEDAFKLKAFSYLNFLLQFTPTVPAETELRGQFAKIGVLPGAAYTLPKDGKGKAAVELGIKEGYEAIAKRRDEIGTLVNGWRVGSSFGDRAFYKGDFTLRAAAALAGIYGNDAVEAMYPLAATDDKGQKLDGSKYNYTITFPAGQYPPVNAFWSVTMYDGKTQLLINNPINRYLINSPMLPDMKKNADGSLTIYVQNKSPGKDKESNWLPAPNGPIYMVMRLYWPKDEALNGTWKPAPIVQGAK
ncbi:MAG: DUF1254 domain-containing protein [Pseudorhodoplanes sp.]